MPRTNVARRKKSIVYGAVLLLGAGVSVANAYQDACLEACEKVADWFAANPDWGQDPEEFYQMCADARCGMT
jgi:hypothetical protein